VFKSKQFGRIYGTNLKELLLIDLDSCITRKLMVCGVIEERYCVWIIACNLRCSPDIIMVRRLILSMRNKIYPEVPNGRDHWEIHIRATCGAVLLKVTLHLKS
jgi:hypothetical protein